MAGLVLCLKPRLRLACRPFVEGHLARRRVARATGLRERISDGNWLMAKGKMAMKRSWPFSSRAEGAHWPVHHATEETCGVDSEPRNPTRMAASDHWGLWPLTTWVLGRTAQMLMSGEDQRLYSPVFRIYYCCDHWPYSLAVTRLRPVRMVSACVVQVLPICSPQHHTPAPHLIIPARESTTSPPLTTSSNWCPDRFPFPCDLHSQSWEMDSHLRKNDRLGLILSIFSSVFLTIIFLGLMYWETFSD